MLAESATLCLADIKGGVGGIDKPRNENKRMESQHSETNTERLTLDRDEGVTPPSSLSRRDLLRGACSAPALAAGGSAAAAALLTASPANAELVLPQTMNQRRNEAQKRRVDAAKHNQKQWKDADPQPVNDDEEDYADHRGSFHKYLLHNVLGEVVPAAYANYLSALEAGDPADFDAIALHPGAVQKLVCPQASLAYVTTGLDPHFGRIAAAPAFASFETSAEMGEVYWAALTRDVPFRNYSVDPLVGQAVADLNDFTSPVGPKVAGLVTAGTFQRGETPGDLVGPYLSQFLWQPVPYASYLVDQLSSVPVAADFMTDFASYLAIQRGANPVSLTAYEPYRRYIYNGRTLAEYLHLDIPFQAYLFAAMVLMSYGPSAIAPSNPYLGSPNQAGFVTFGPSDGTAMVTKVADLALRAAWFQKWPVHRRIRPEAYGCRLTVHLAATKNYGLPNDIADSAAVAALLSAQSNALLPMAYPEGCPAHPAYPSGHATVSGACATVLKALFNEAFVIPNPVEASADGTTLDPWVGANLTVGGELNKLASNIGLGRDMAGVHWRSDIYQGLLLGEQVALAMLADETRNYNEDFGGFELTAFDGSPVLVAEGEVFWS
jgi:membrane-associated phospholipid phosphatase